MEVTLFFGRTMKEKPSLVLRNTTARTTGIALNGKIVRKNASMFSSVTTVILVEGKIAFMAVSIISMIEYANIVIMKECNKEI